MPPLGIFLAFFFQRIFSLEITNSRAAFFKTSLELNAFDEKEKRKRGHFLELFFFSTDMYVTNFCSILFLLLDFISILLLIIILSLLFLLLLDLVPAAGSTVKSCEDEGMYSRS